MATKKLTKKQRKALQEQVVELKKQRLYHTLKLAELDQQIAAQREEMKDLYHLRNEAYGEEFGYVDED